MSETDQTTTSQAPADADRPVQADDHLCRQVEAALMTSDRPLPAAKLSQLLGKDQAPGKVIADAIAQLNATYEKTGRSFRVEQVAGGWQVMTLADYDDLLASMHKASQQSRLSPAALEALAIIAYKQPILRADIEAIRGVACGEVLRSLMDRQLIKIVGRAEELGRPMLYGTTKTFLEVFGLAGLNDLPKPEEFAGGG